MKPLFDNFATQVDGGIPLDTYTWEHNSSGGNRALLVGLITSDGTDDLLSVTCDGVEMARVSTYLADGFNGRFYIYVITGQALGVNEMVASFSNVANHGMVSLSYKLVDQASPIDNVGEDSAPELTSSHDFSITPLSAPTLMVLWSGGQRVATFTAPALKRGSGGGVAVIDGGDADIPTDPAAETIINLTYADAVSPELGAIFCTLLASAPELLVETDEASDIATHGATANAQLVDVNTDAPDLRGFVFGTTSLGDPGNVAAVDSGYDSFEEESGAFSPGVFSALLSSLLPSTVYYFRAYAHDDAGYLYGEEKTFTTSTPSPFRFINLPGIVFDEEDTTTIYAERLNNILERLEALEP